MLPNIRNIERSTSSEFNGENSKGIITVTNNFNSVQDKIWFNVEIRPNSGLPVNTTRCDYNQQFDLTILKNPEEYFCTVSRFSVPCGLIPCFSPKFIDIGTGQTAYSVTVSYLGVDSQVYVLYTPRNNYDISDDRYKFIYSYDDFVSMINTALSTAFGSIATPVGSVAPWFQYNNGIFSFVCDRAHYDSSLANPVYVYMNNELNILMNGISTIYNSGAILGKDYLIDVRDMKNNWYTPSYSAVVPGDFYIFSQNYNNMAAWNPLTSLRLVSSTLPLKKEYIHGSGGILSGEGILQDFIPLFSTSEFKPDLVQYVATNYHLVNMTGHVPINKLDFRFVWVDNDGVEHNVLIPVGGVCSIEVAFFKKSTLTC